MNVLKLMLDLALAGVVIYIVVVTVLQYRKETGSTWQRLLATAQDSATMLWSKLVVVAAAIAANLDNIAGALNMPEFQAWVHQVLGNPQILAGVMAMVGFVTMLARMRTLFRL